MTLSETDTTDLAFVSQQKADTPASLQDIEEASEDGTEILFTRKRLYHGSPKSDLLTLLVAEEDTVGKGVYLTSDKTSAQGYAYRRQRQVSSESAVVYEVEVTNLRMLDLRSQVNVRKFIDKLYPYLLSQRENEVKNLEQGMISFRYNSLTGAIESIERIRDNLAIHISLKQVFESIGITLANYLKENGFQGLLTQEGGEGDDISDHDTYLVIDPKDIRIIKCEVFGNQTE